MGRDGEDGGLGETIMKKATVFQQWLLFWRRGPESNRPTRICNPVHNRFATAPLSEKKGKLWASLFHVWSGKRGSNSRPQPWQGCALPTELLPLERQSIAEKRPTLHRPAFNVSQMPLLECLPWQGQPPPVLHPAKGWACAPEKFPKPYRANAPARFPNSVSHCLESLASP